MLYGLLMLVGTQLGARLHNRLAGGILMITLGGLLTGVALYLPGSWRRSSAWRWRSPSSAWPRAWRRPRCWPSCPISARRRAGATAPRALPPCCVSPTGRQRHRPAARRRLVLRLGHADAIAAIGGLSGVTALAFFLLMLSSTRGGRMPLDEQSLGRR
jgi:uncharacterized membrane protein YfcA